MPAERTPLVVVIIPKTESAPVARQPSPLDRHNYTPPQKQSPLTVAQFWLRSRLEERPNGYFVDGTPATLDRIMRETNRLLIAHGENPMNASPRWLP